MINLPCTVTSIDNISVYSRNIIFRMFPIIWNKRTNSLITCSCSATTVNAVYLFIAGLSENLASITFTSYAVGKSNLGNDWWCSLEVSSGLNFYCFNPDGQSTAKIIDILFIKSSSQNWFHNLNSNKLFSWTMN